MSKIKDDAIRLMNAAKDLDGKVLEQAFVSSPYSHTDPVITQQRVDAVTAFVHHRLVANEMVISPIVYGHSIVLTHQLPGTYEFWETFCLSMLKPCTKLYVLCLDGWVESVGMRGEIEAATLWNIPITYVLPGTFAYSFHSECP